MNPNEQSPNPAAATQANPIDPNPVGSSAFGSEAAGPGTDGAEPAIRVTEPSIGTPMLERSSTLVLGLLRSLQRYAIVLSQTLNQGLDWLFHRLQVTNAVVLMLRTSGLVVALVAPIWPLVAVLQVGLWGWFVEVIVNVGIGLAMVGAAEMMQKVDSLSQLLASQEPSESE